MVTWAGMELSPVRRVLQRLLSPRVLRFAAVGFSGVFVNLGALYLFADVLDLRDWVGSALAVEVSIVWNFVLNNAWTFADKNTFAEASFSLRLVRYVLVSHVGLGIQLAAFVLLTGLITRTLQLPEAGLWKYPAQLAGIGLAIVWNFLSNFMWTWAQAAPAAAVALGSAGGDVVPPKGPAELERP